MAILAPTWEKQACYNADWIYSFVFHKKNPFALRSKVAFWYRVWGKHAGPQPRERHKSRGVFSKDRSLLQSWQQRALFSIWYLKSFTLIHRQKGQHLWIAYIRNSANGKKFPFPLMQKFSANRITQEQKLLHMIFPVPPMSLASLVRAHSHRAEDSGEPPLLLLCSGPNLVLWMLCVTSRATRTQMFQLHGMGHGYAERLCQNRSLSVPALPKEESLLNSIDILQVLHVNGDITSLLWVMYVSSARAAGYIPLASLPRLTGFYRNKVPTAL